MTPATVPPLSSSNCEAAGRIVLEGLRQQPLGTLSKQDLEVLVLNAMTHGHELDLGSHTFDLARRLRLTPARVRGLLVRFRLQHGYDFELAKAGQTDRQHYEDQVFRDLLRTARFNRAGDRVEFLVKDPFFKHVVVERFERDDVTIDGAFNGSIVRVPLVSFIKMYEHKMGRIGSTAIKRALRRDPARVLDTASTSLARLAKLAGTALGSAAAGDVLEAIVQQVADGVEESAIVESLRARFGQA